MTTAKRPTSEEKLARYYEDRRDDESLWSPQPATARVRRERGVLFSLRLPAEELDSLRREAERLGTTVSALLRDGAKLLVEGPSQERSGDYRLPDELGQRVAASRPLIETILEEEQSFDACVNLCIALGLERILTDIIGKADAPILVQAILQIAQRAPEAVYGHTAEVLQRGAEGSEGGEVGPAEPAETQQGALGDNVVRFDTYRQKVRGASTRLGSGIKA